MSACVNFNSAVNMKLFVCKPWILKQFKQHVWRGLSTKSWKQTINYFGWLFCLSRSRHLICSLWSLSVLARLRKAVVNFKGGGGEINLVPRGEGHVGSGNGNAPWSLPRKIITVNRGSYWTVPWLYLTTWKTAQWHHTWWATSLSEWSTPLLTQH